jgi:hypothetical protein
MRLVTAALLAALLAGCAPEGDAAGVADLSANASRLKVGLFLGDDDSEAALALAEARIERHLDLLLVYHSVAADPAQVGLPALLARLASRGTALCLALEPAGTMDEIASGLYDARLAAWGDALARGGAPVWLRFASEMNGNWDTWDAGTDPVRNAPARFVAAWRRARAIVAGRLAAAGAPPGRVRWVFTAAAHPVSNIAAFWPGTDQVELIAMDGYNQPGNGWRTFRQVFDDGYRALAALDPKKPLMIGEFSSDRAANFAQGRDRAAWIHDAAAQLAARYPRIAAFNWFDVGTPSAPANGHSYALSDDDGTVAAFAESFGIAKSCAADADCNGGRRGTGVVCGNAGRCIPGCHSDLDCPAGERCDTALPRWACR